MDTAIDYKLVLGLMNGRVSSSFRRKVNEDFHRAKVEITSEQWDVLLAISMQDICTQQQLSEATCYSKSTMTRLLNTLEEKGIILRDKSRTDWRSNYIRITRFGFQVYEKARTIALQSLQDTLHGLTHAEINATQNTLKTVLKNLQEINNEKKNEEIQAQKELQKRRAKLIRALIVHKQLK